MKLRYAPLLLLLCGCAATFSNGFSAPDGGEADASPFDRDAACGTTRTAASLTKAPMDIIFVIDNSTSMTREIQAVERNINASFASLIASSGLDYRVIVLGRHGDSGATQSICIAAPLSGATSCTPPPARPAFTSNFFHYSVEISSQNAYDLVLSTYAEPDEFGLAPDGWRAWLRPEAFKVFVVLSDDDSSRSADSFEQSLVQLQPANFGTIEQRRFLVHAIVGVTENTPASAAYAPTDPIVTGHCIGSQRAGLVHQQLAIRTGGLRYPVCQAASYDAVFRLIAEGILVRSAAACELALPAPPPGRVFRWDNPLLEYRSGGGRSEILERAADSQSCTASRFQYEAGKIRLCPQACTRVQADPQAELDFLLACDYIVN